MTRRELLDELEAQEECLVFDRFDDGPPGPSGLPSATRAVAESAGRDLDPSQRTAPFPRRAARLLGRQRRWLARKSAVVDRYGRSSLRVGEQFRVDGGSFDHDSRLDPALFAAHGGAFPILLRGTGCIGSVAVSGLPQLDDHQLVVDTLEALLADVR